MLILAKLAEEALGRLNLVRFIGPIFVGIILGQGVLDIIKINIIISFITSLGIVFLLFLAGAEELGEGIKINLKDFISADIELIVPILLVGLMLYYLHEFSPLILIPLAMTSVGPLTRLLIDLNIIKEKIGISIFYQSMINEIISVVIFALFYSKFKPSSIIGILVLVIMIFALGGIIAKTLELIEKYIKVREIEFASIISLILIVGFIAEYYDFNSAITALFLGFLLRDYLKDRPQIIERLRGFTYGFFEPLFFVSIGLYFVKISLQLIYISIILLLVVIASKFISGLITANFYKMDKTLNALGTSVKGGVDVSLLIIALTSNLISSFAYSFSSLTIALSSLLVPLIFRLKYGKPRTQEKEKITYTQEVAKILKNKTTTNEDEILREVINKMTSNGYRALVVVDENERPLGYISIQQIIEIDPSEYDILKVKDLDKNDLITMEDSAKVIDVLKKFRETEAPVIGIVDKDERLVSVVYERELLRMLTTS
ncbi:CBS domain-containing protein [Acidianus sulfidivorans JP7]|uniref:Sodium:proton antiporter n=2 Tax=Acidianus TaxID=12914 RepID=A0A2U9IQT8_9CREN|nr:CBS domain-containing protein [Acidianus sulfidivorans JP7]